MAGPDESAPRLLVLVGSDRNRELLADRLSEEYDVVAPADPELVGSFDCCVVGEEVLPAVADDLRRRREAAQPIYLPALLLAAPRERGPGPWERYADRVGDVVDGIAELPLGERQLAVGVDRLVRIREFSIELAEQRDRLELYRRAMDEASIGIIITDAADDQPIVYANEGFLELTGYEESEVLGRNCRFLQGEDTDPEPVARMREAVAEAEPVTVEVLNYREDGTPFYNEVTIVPVHDGDEVTHFLGFQRDVTERVERQGDLRRTVGLLEQAQRLADIGAWAYGVEADELRWSDQLYRIHGVDESFEPTMKNVLELYPPEERERITEGFERALEGGGSFSLEHPYVTPDGEEKWLRSHAETTVADGEVVHVYGTVQDVTERVEHERELERYERIVETTDDPIFATDDEGRFTLVNDALVETVGVPREEVLGRHYSETFAEDESIDRELEVRLVEGEAVQFTTHIATDGDDREFEVRVAPLMDDGEYVGSVGVARDVSAVRERDRRLSVLDRVLRHNLRNKMNLVLAYAEAIEETADGEVSAHAGKIHDAAAELLDISDDARRFRSSVAPGEGEVSTYDLAAGVPGIVEQASLAHPDAEFSVDVPDSAPVRAHEATELAVEELVENAVIHNDRDRPSVDVTVRESGEGYELRVADDGPGIDDVARRVLESGEETQMEHASGLGLWLVRWTATSSGGHLDIADRDPRGTVATMWLPAADSPE